MAYDAARTLTQGREKIFEAFDTHSVQATFLEEQTSGYDFATQSVVSTSSSITIQALPVTRSSVSATVVPDYDQDLYVRSEQVEPSLYSEVSWCGKRFNVVDFEENDYVTRFLLKELR